MGCISSRSTISSQQYRHTDRYSDRRVPDALAERNVQNLQFVVTCHQSSNSISALNSREQPRNYPTITQRPSIPKPTKPCFGEYRCICGRTWTSRLSWQGNYQICKRCKRSVHPFKQRELRPSDISSDKESVEQHPKELCQKCQQLGFYCGKGKNIKPRTS